MSSTLLYSYCFTICFLYRYRDHRDLHLPTHPSPTLPSADLLTRRWANDRRFQVGGHILRHKSDVDASGRALSDIAEVALRGLYGPVLEDVARRHGHLPGSGLAVVALGKLGSREMTVSSDLDLVFLYEQIGRAHV